MPTPKPKKIVERRTVIPMRGRWKGKPVQERVVRWEINGRSYRTRQLAIEAAALHAFEREMIDLCAAPSS